MPSAAPRPCTAPGCRRLIAFRETCPDHPPRADWKRRETHRGTRHERGYGTAWTKLRETILLRDRGLCQPCEAHGRITAASAVDHITPKSHGGTDAPGNLQSICHTCHAEKTALESVAGGYASPYPEWLPMPRIPVIVIAGPPCSGKLDYARSIATERDLVIDVNELARRADPSVRIAVAGTPQLRNAIRARNTLLASLAHPRCAWQRAILTTTAQTPERRQWWKQKLGATVVVMDTSKAECKARLAREGLPAVRALELSHLIDAWR